MVKANNVVDILEKLYCIKEGCFSVIVEWIKMEYFEN